MLDDHALDLLFREARTHRHWQDRPVDSELLERVWNLAKFGPTSANCLPLRAVFVTTPEAKERLRPCMMEGNVEQTMAAPVTAIFGHDLEFYEELPRLYPGTDARSWFAGKEKAIEATAFRNAALQGAYFMLAARALGLDCGPMSGFSQKKINETFFEGTSIKANFLCNLGYGVPGKLEPRLPRLAFAEACDVI